MAEQQLFYPDKALVFRSLPEQFSIIMEMRERYDQLKGTGYTSHDAFYFAFVLTHPNNYGISTALGADDFYVRLTRLLSAAQDMVEQLIDQYLRPFGRRLAFHNTIANCLDPAQMLILATSEQGAGASHLDRRRQFEATRQLGIALQLFSIDTVDSESHVAQDMGMIEQLSWERLFTKGISQDLWITYEVGKNHSSNARARNLQCHLTSREKSKANKKRRKRGSVVGEELLSCRIAVLDEDRYFIYAINRRKRLFSTLTKLERGRPFTDRRGWKYVVVAVQHGEQLRVATRDDATRFHARTQDLLWQPPLLREEDTSPVNPHRNAGYWDLKQIGRILHPDDGRDIAGSAEQLTTTVRDHLDAIISTDSVNHALYRAGQIFSVIVPLWFPHRREPFQQFPSFRLPGYGVDWSLNDTQRQLETWWKSQL